MRQGLATHHAVGAGIFYSYYLALLAEAYRNAGQVEEGVSALAEALVVIDKTGERFYEAELYRLYGELSLRMGERETGRADEEEKMAELPIHPFVHFSPEECFLKAIEIAQKQHAKMWELRATVSLARLWQQQGKHHAARNALSQIYHWFAEGFDTTDLQEAKALLDSLASSI
jgi:predicted ATPase